MEERDDSKLDGVGHDLKGEQPKRSDGPSISGSAKGRDRHRKDDRKRKHKRRKEESGESDSNSSEVEGRRSRRRRRRERKERSVSESGSEDSADSEELDRKERKRKRKQKRQRREKKLKKEKRRRKADSEGDEGSGEDAKKKKLLKEAKKFLKKHSGNVGQELVLRAVGRKVEPISEGDYFQKNAEFATWLREGRGLFFSDLSSDQAHALFDSFVTVYNEGKMPDKYYDGIPGTQVQRTGFAWAIRGRGETGEGVAF